MGKTQQELLVMFKILYGSMPSKWKTRNYFFPLHELERKNIAWFIPDNGHGCVSILNNREKLNISYCCFLYSTLDSLCERMSVYIQWRSNNLSCNNFHFTLLKNSK